MLLQEEYIQVAKEAQMLVSPLVSKLILLLNKLVLKQVH